MGFKDLKKQSSLGSLTNRLVKEVEKMNNAGGGNVDDRLWKPEVDKSGNGYAVVRFLPAPDGEELPWVKLFSHAFQGPGGWYIENSLTTIGQKDPVGDLNRTLWNSGNDTDKDTVRKQKRKLSYYSNIYVVKDPSNPQNEGRVFLYKYGKKIFDKIMESMQPAFEDETPVNPFDLWKGADFKLKITKVAGFWNYDKSEFDAPSVLGDLDDKELEGIWKQEHSLAAFTADDQFKSYDELKERLERTLKGNYSAKVEEEQFEEELTPEPLNVKDGVVQGGQHRTAAASTEDDTLSYFAKLAQED